MDPLDYRSGPNTPRVPSTATALRTGLICIAAAIVLIGSVTIWTLPFSKYIVVTAILSLCVGVSCLVNVAIDRRRGRR